MSLFNESELPFNLSGEPLDNSLTAEGEARVKAQAESEARKAQTTFDELPTDCVCGFYHVGLCDDD